MSPQNTQTASAFTADPSRRDKLRGWCKVCETAARAARYNQKRKAAATAGARAASEHTLSRRRCGQFSSVHLRQSDLYELAIVHKGKQLRPDQ